MKESKNEYSFIETIQRIKEGETYAQVKHGLHQIRIEKEEDKIYISYYLNDEKVKDENYGLVFGDFDRFIKMESRGK